MFVVLPCFGHCMGRGGALLKMFSCCAPAAGRDRQSVRGGAGSPTRCSGVGGGVGWRVGSIGLSLFDLLAYIGRSSARPLIGLPVVLAIDLLVAKPCS